jgi:hypothetical protein
MMLTSRENEPAPSLKVLHKHLARGEQLQEQVQVPRGLLHLWIGGVRSQLFRIYGRDSKQLTYFPLPPQDMNFPQTAKELELRLSHLKQIISALETMVEITSLPTAGNRIFIGHGLSSLWREVKDFLADRLSLPWDEFNREAVAGTQLQNA